MEIEILTHGEDGDNQTLAVVNWPTTPHKGDTIMLSGPMFGSGEHSDDVEDATVFEVLDVYWNQHVGKNKHPSDVLGAEDELEVQVFVVEPPATTATFVPLCTCEESLCVPKSDDSTRCESCGDRLGRRHTRMIAQREARKTTL